MIRRSWSLARPGNLHDHQGNSTFRPSYPGSTFSGNDRRILVVSGHGGNAPVGALAQELMAEWGDVSIRFHEWWKAPRTWATGQEIDPTGSHANWMENFPWTRLAGVAMPAGQKPMIDFAHMRLLSPQALRAYLGDGNFGGRYQRADEEMLAIWEVGVVETPYFR